MNKEQYIQELYDWVELNQKEFLLNYINEETFKDLLWNSGLQLSDIQSIISNRHCLKENFCPPKSVYIMQSPTIVNYFDPDFKIARERITYNYTVPIYSTQIQLMVLRYLGLNIPLKHYEVSLDSIYGIFDSVVANLGMKEIFSRDYDLIEKNIISSVENSVKYQPTEKWRKENKVDEITVKDQLEILKNSQAYNELLKFCNR